MKKYKLLKDLLGLREGDIIEFENIFGLITDETRYTWDPANLPEWFEEIKEEPTEEQIETYRKLVESPVEPHPCSLCGEDHNPITHTFVSQSTGKEECKQKLVLTSPTTLQWANGDMLEWTGAKVLFNGVDINEAIKAKQEIKPSQWINARAEELNAECTICKLPSSLCYNCHMIKPNWAVAIENFLDEHFSK